MRNPKQKTESRKQKFLPLLGERAGVRASLRSAPCALILISTFCFLLSAFAASAGTFACQWNSADFAGVPLSNKFVFITPIAPYGVDAPTSTLINRDRRRYTNNSAGILVVSNMFNGRSYRVEFQGRFEDMVITNSFGTSVTGLVNAIDYLAAPISDAGVLAYSQAAADARFLQRTQGTGSSVTLAGTNTFQAISLGGEPRTNWPSAGGSGTFDFTSLSNVPPVLVSLSTNKANTLTNVGADYPHLVGGAEYAIPTVDIDDFFAPSIPISSFLGSASGMSRDGAPVTNLQSSALTGALPPIDGSQLTGINGELNPFLIHQDAEGTGFDHGEVWTKHLNGGGGSGAVVNEDYLISPLQGAQSIRIVFTNSSAEVVVPFSSQDEAWGYFLFRPVTIANFSTPCEFLGPSASGSDTLFYFNPGGTIHAEGTTSGGNTVGAMTAGTLYHVWIHARKNSGGANGVLDIGFSTDGTRPTSGNNFVQITGQNFPNQFGGLQLGLDTAQRTAEYIFDKVRVAPMEIGDNGAVDLKTILAQKVGTNQFSPPMGYPTQNLAAVAFSGNGTDISSGTVADARIASTITRDSEFTTPMGYPTQNLAAVAFSGSGSDIASGTVADARIASTITRDTEFTTPMGYPTQNLGTVYAPFGVGLSNNDTRVITLLSNLIMQINAIGTGQIAGLALSNGTASATNAQQNSPMLWLYGNGYRTGTSQSTNVGMGVQVQPVQGGSLNPTWSLVFYNQLGTNPATLAGFSINSAGLVTAASDVTAGGRFTLSTGTAHSGFRNLNVSYFVVQTGNSTDTNVLLVLQPSTIGATAAGVLSNWPAMRIDGSGNSVAMGFVNSANTGYIPITALQLISTNRDTGFSIALTNNQIAFRGINNSNPPTAGAATAFIFAASNVVSELFAEDGAGNITQISPHAFDGPPTLYDDTDEMPMVSREVNVYTGKGRWINHSREARRVEQLLGCVRVLAGLVNTNGLTAAQIARLNAILTLSQADSDIVSVTQNYVASQSWTNVQARLQNNYRVAFTNSLINWTNDFAAYTTAINEGDTNAVAPIKPTYAPPPVDPIPDWLQRRGVR